MTALTLNPDTRATPAHAGLVRRAWIITGMLVLFQMINFADKAILGLVAEPVMRDLGLSPGEFGFIGGAFFFLFALSAVLVGFLAGWVQSRWIILSMGLAWAVLQFPMLLGGGAALLLGTRIVLGAAEGPATPISLQHVQGWFPATDRGLPSSLVAMGSTLGPLVAAPLLAWIIAHPDWGWRWAFGFMGVTGLGWTLAWAVLSREGPYAACGRAGEGAKPQAAVSALDDQVPPACLRRVFLSPMFVVATLAGAGCFWAQGFLTTWSPRYLTSVVALSPEWIGLVSTLPWLMGAAALFVLGVLSRRAMRRGVSVRWALGAMFGATLAASGLAFLALPWLDGYVAVAVLTLAAGLAMIFPLAPATVAYCVAARQRGAVMAVLTGVASLGGVVSPMMVGYLMQKAAYVPGMAGGSMDSGIHSAFWFIGCYLLVTGLGCVAVLNPDALLRRWHACQDERPGRP